MGHIIPLKPSGTRCRLHLGRIRPDKIPRSGYILRTVHKTAPSSCYGTHFFSWYPSVFRSVHTRSQVGAEIFDDFDFGTINILADIYVGPTKISTVRFSNLISGDIAGSPNWGEVFPGVSADGAKEAFRSRFTILNVRMVDVNNRLTGMASWVRERENERTYADAMDRARQLEQAGDLEGA